MTAPASRKTRRAPQPQDVPEVAHNGHGDVDSRGLLLAPDNDLAWTRGPLGRHSLVPVHGGYSDPEAPTTLLPCYFCADPAPPVPGQDYGVCGFPLFFGEGGSVVDACLERAARKRDAERERVAAEEAAAKAKAAARAPRKPRVRPSQAKEAALSKNPAKTAEAAAGDATEAPGDGAA